MSLLFAREANGPLLGKRTMKRASTGAGLVDALFMVLASGQYNLNIPSKIDK
jgi:hypothetical protein